MKLIFFILVLCLATFFRFYNFSELFHFTMDEEYWSYIPWNIASFYHLPLIGGSIAGTGLYTGPLFVYLMSIPAFVFNGNPLGFGYTVAALGVLTSVLIFILGKKIFAPKVAALAAFFYSSSFLVAIFDRHYWNASLTPFLSLLALFFLTQIIARGRTKFYLPLAFILALGVHSHGTGLALILGSVVSLLLFCRHLLNKFSILGVLLFFFLQLPLLLFDLRHDFLITKAALSYSSKHPNANIIEKAGEVSQVYTSFAGRMIYFSPKDLDIEQTLCPFYQKQQPQALISYLAIITLVLGSFIALKTRSVAGRVSLIFVLSTLVGLLFFREKISEYYFASTIVPSFFLISSVLGKVSRKKIGALAVASCLALYLYLNLQNLITAKRQVSFNAKIEGVMESLKLVDGAPFTLRVQSLGPCQLYGYRYLYSYLGREPVASYMDHYFTWLYERKIPKKEPVYEILLNINAGKVNPSITKLERTSY